MKKFLFLIVILVCIGCCNCQVTDNQKQQCCDSTQCCDSLFYENDTAFFNLKVK